MGKGPSSSIQSELIPSSHQQQPVTPALDLASRATQEEPNTSSLPVQKKSGLRLTSEPHLPAQKELCPPQRQIPVVPPGMRQRLSRPPASLGCRMKTYELGNSKKPGLNRFQSRSNYTGHWPTLNHGTTITTRKNRTGLRTAYWTSLGTAGIGLMRKTF